MQTAPARHARGFVNGTVSVALVGSSVVASNALNHYPLLLGQTIRYGAATVCLYVFARARRTPLPRPVRRDWPWLVALGVFGMAGGSLAIVDATTRSGPGTVGIMIGAAPVLIAVVGPALQGRRPDVKVVAAALLVALGVGAVQIHGDRSGVHDATAVLLGVAVLVAVAAQSLLAAPVLTALRPIDAGLYGSAVATASLVAVLVANAIAVRRLPVPRPSAAEAASLGFLALGVTAVVLICWYGAVNDLGVERAGLQNGLVPIVALGAVVLTGGDRPTWPQFVGAAVVTLAIGVGRRKAARPRAASSVRPTRMLPRAGRQS